MSDNLEEKMLGAWLKEQRKLKNVSLEEIAAVTKVHISQLKMIEEDQWSELPAPTFVRGFLICYSKHLGLDEEDILRRYKTVISKDIRTIESALPKGNKGVQSASRPKVRVASTPNFKGSPGANEVDFNQKPLFTPKKVALLSVGIVVVILLVVLISFGRKKEGIPQTSPAPLATENVTAPTAPMDSTHASTPAPTPEASGSTTAATPQPSLPVEHHTLELVGIEESWVIVKNGEDASEGFSLKAKEKRSFDISPRAQLVLSNAGAVEIRWNGVLYEAPGFRGDVKRLRLPDQLDTLKEKKKAPAPRLMIAPRTTAPTTPADALPGRETSASPATPASSDAPSVSAP